jgi:hypothetical protein
LVSVTRLASPYSLPILTNPRLLLSFRGITEPEAERAFRKTGTPFVLVGLVSDD